VVTTVRRTRVAPILRALAVMAIVLIADRITKHLVKTHIQPGQSKHVFSWLHLVHDQNNGVAFGFLSGGGALVVIITAAVALAGLGFDATKVRLIADPKAARNVHEISVRAGCGDFDLQLEGRPSPLNPKTSLMAGFSVAREILNRTGALVV